MLLAVGEIQKFLESSSLVEGGYRNVVVEGDELNNPGVLNHKFSKLLFGALFKEAKEEVNNNYRHHPSRLVSNQIQSNRELH